MARSTLSAGTLPRRLTGEIFQVGFGALLGVGERDQFGLVGCAALFRPICEAIEHAPGAK